jgi:hypothetical protein
MDYTKWLEAYAVSNQEASTMAVTLVTNFVCRFGVPREVRSDQGYNFPSLTQDVLQCLGMSKRGRHHTPVSAVGQHNEAVYQNGRGAPVKSHCVAPEGLEREVAYFPRCL